MKIISVILLSMVLGKGCESEQKQDLATAVVTYQANTRGFYQKIVVQHQSAIISNERKNEDHPTAKKIPDAQWNALVAALSKLSLDELPNLKAPSEKRFYDGAAIATLTVMYKGQTYESSAFDHGEPPAEIKNVVEQILALAK